METTTEQPSTSTNEQAPSPQPGGETETTSPNPLPPRRGNTQGIVLPPRTAEKAREEQSFREQMAAHQAGVAMLRVEAEVRRLAREEELSAKEEQGLVERARVSFRIVDGRAVPVGADGRTVLMAADGARMMTVEEWTKKHLTQPSPQGGEGSATTNGHQSSASAPAQMPMRNPFRKKFWNLTEQMRLRKSDPEFAAKLEAEAWVEG